MRKFGLAAILTFVDKGATATIGRVGAAAAILKKRFMGIGSGVAGIARGFGTIAMSALPVAGLFGLMAKKGMDFETAIAKLRAVTLDTANKTTPALRSLAKTLGATTVFSASEAADAMTNLARAGLTADQIMGAVKGTLNAAAAEGIDLATAADMVASNIKAFGMEAEEAAKIAGVLALASARTNTNMVQLQEGLKMAAPSVKPLNATLSDTAALLGGLADIGLKGTLGGTGIRSAMSKLLAPTKQGRGAIAGLGISYENLKKSMDKGDIIGTFKQVLVGMKTLPNKSDRAAAAIKIFGLRGIGMASALDLSDKAMTRFNETTELLRKETGATAKQMAEIQLQTLSGQVTLLKSAFEGLSIEIFDVFSTETRGGVKWLATGIQNIALAMRVMAGEKIVDPEAAKQIKEMPKVFFEIAGGIRAGLGDVKAFFQELGKSIGWVGEKFGLTGDGSAKSTSRIITKVALLTATMAPLGLVVMGVTRLFSGLAQVAVGAFKVVGNTLALAARGTGGLIGMVGKRVPKFGAFLGKFGGLLGKAGRVAEAATASPVRVVNFAEMGVASKIGPMANQLPLFGGNAAGSTAGAGMFAGMRAGLAGAVGRLGTFGKFLNSAAFSASGAAGVLGKAGLVGAALGAGYALGTLLDNATGASDRLANLFWNKDKDARETISKSMDLVTNELRANQNAAATLKQLVEMRKRGVTEVVGPEGKRSEITQELARQRLAESLRLGGMNQSQIVTILGNMSTLLAQLPRAGTAPVGTKPVKVAKDAMVSTSGFLPVSAGDVLLDRASLAGAVVSGLRGGLAGAAGAGAFGGGDPGRTSPPHSSGGGSLRIEIPVVIDGRQIARAVASVRLDDLERSGASLEPGTRDSLLRRGFEEVSK